MPGVRFLLASLLPLLLLHACHSFVIPSNADSYCPTGWTRGIIVPSKCYRVKNYNGATVNFMGAEHKCKDWDSRANLVTIYNAFENSDVAALTSYTGDFWIGYSDLPGKGIWGWVSGLNVSNFAAWDSREPAKDNGNTCAYLSMSGNGLWRTWECNDDTSNGYICELNL